MSYIVVLINDYKSDHLKAMSNDGTHGLANCQFPKVYNKIDRYNKAFEGTTFEVYDLIWTGKFYRVTTNNIVRRIPIETNSSILYELRTSGLAWTLDNFKEVLAKHNIEFEGNMSTKATSSTIEEPEEDPDDIIQEPIEEPTQVTSPKKIGKAKISLDWMTENMKNKSILNTFNLNESLFTPSLSFLGEADEDGNDIKTGRAFNFKTTPSSDVRIDNMEEPEDEYNPELELMVGSPLFSNGTPKLEAWILIKLYEACIDPGTTATTGTVSYTDPITGEYLEYPGIERAELLKRVGTALHDTPAQSQTFFDLFKELGLAYINPTGKYTNTVFPGAYLKDWVEGKDLQLTVPDTGKSYEKQYHYKKDAKGKYTIPFERPYGGGEDLRKWLNKGNLPKKTPISSATLRADGTGYGDNPFADYPGITRVANPNVKKSTSSENEPAYFTSPTPEPTKKSKIGKAKISLDWMTEGIEDEAEKDTSYFDNRYVRQQERENAFIENVKTEYRKYRNLDEDVDISDKFDEFQFRCLCCDHNWPYKTTKDKVWGKGN